MIGFETIGNATAIFYDHNPVLVTDPWIDGFAYFGSWGLTHEIPETQLDAIRRSRYVWLSHGHPDHINSDSLELLNNKTFLIADHAGGRIAGDLRESGRNVQILPAKKWVNLTPNIKVISIPDHNQDSILLVDVRGDLVCNLNDASDHGWGPFVRRIASKYKNSFLLRISGYGDATMINYWTEDGEQAIPPHITRNKRIGVGARLHEAATAFGTTFVVPFSSLHRYQRTDSVWANEHVAPLSDYKRGFNSERAVLTDAFIRWDSEKKYIENLSPRPLEGSLYSPEEFGDNWSDPLAIDDRKKIDSYISKHAALESKIGFVRFIVGGVEHTVRIDKKSPLGFTFYAPRGSLMKVVEHEIFDDLLIGNFARTIVHGAPSNPRFPPLDTLKLPLLYGDQGRALTADEIDMYMQHYHRMFPIIFLKRALLGRTEQIVRKFTREGTTMHRLGRRTYRFIR